MSSENQTLAESHSGGGVKILQFTDTHLFADPEEMLLGINTFQSFQQVLQLALEKQWVPEVILATGDLTQNPNAKAYAIVRRFFQEFCGAIDPNQETEIPVYWLPGNHDDAQTMAKMLPGGPMQTTHSFCRGAWQVILLDSSIPGEVGGFLEKDELSRLEISLIAHPELFTLVCVHHNPVPTAEQWMGEIGLNNSQEFFQILSRHPKVKAVLFGHIHQEFEREQNGIRLLATPSTCFQFKPEAIEFALDDKAPGYRWLHLMDNGEIQTGVHRVENFAQHINLKSEGY